MEHKLLLEVPEDVYESLVETAGQMGQPYETVAVEWLTAVTRYVAHDPLEKFIGAFGGNIPDWAERHDLYLGKSILETAHSAEYEVNSDA